MSHRLSSAPAAFRSLAVIGAAGAVLLSACGSGASPNSAATAEKTREQQLLRFSKCLREHGLNVSTSSGGGAVRIGRGGDTSPQTVEAAQNACKKYAPGQNEKLTPQQRVEREEAVQKFAKCMREHGIKVEAKTTSGGGIAIGIHQHSGERGPNPESPAFQAAQKACQSYLPLKPPPGGPGGPSTNRSTAGGAGGGQKSGFSVAG